MKNKLIVEELSLLVVSFLRDYKEKDWDVRDAICQVERNDLHQEDISDPEEREALVDLAMRIFPN